MTDHGKAMSVDEAKAAQVAMCPCNDYGVERIYCDACNTAILEAVRQGERDIWRRAILQQGGDAVLEVTDAVASLLMQEVKRD